MAFDRREYKGAAAATTLNGDITSGSTTIVITSGTGWPTGATGPFTIVIERGLAGEEKIKCSARAGTTLTVASSGRGYDNTTAASHTSGKAVEHVMSAIDLDEANQAAHATLGAVTTKGDQLVGTTANAIGRVAVGSNNQLWIADSAQTAGVKWGALPDGAVSSAAKFGSGVVDAAALATGAVTSAKILDATIATGDLADSAVTAAKIADATITAAKLVNATITETQLATSIAGNGLAGGAGTALSVGVDGSTIEISSDQVRVKDAGITAAKIATNSIRTYRQAAASTPSSPQVGDLWFQTDTFKLLEYQSVTTGWTPPWNLPWGYFGSNRATSDQTSVTTLADVSGVTTGAFTTVANRLISVRARIMFASTSGTPAVQQLQLLDSGDTILAYEITDHAVAALNTTIAIESETIVTGAGSNTIRLKFGRGGSDSATYTVKNSVMAGWIRATDEGPNGNPT